MIEKKSPIVSVKTLTYNHAPYIRNCIEGVLMQKTNFQIEFIIGDDGSTDGTTEIIKEYADNHPDIIKPVLSEKNMGIKNNSRRVNEVISGKYIAYCEGDDYWVDPYKLQKQVDFLESNPDYGMVHTGYSRYYEEKSKRVFFIKKKIPVGDIFADLLTTINYIGTLTVLIRTDLYKYVDNILEEPSEKYNWKMGDLPCWLGISKISKVGYIKDKTAIYRILQESASHPADDSKYIEFIKSSFDIMRWYCKKYDRIDLKPIIDENEIYYLYYVSLLNDFDAIKDFREVAKSHKLKRAKVRNIIIDILSKNIVAERIYRYLYQMVFR
jgi:glycosyltransferase involved in cell wall biosynthesis